VSEIMATLGNYWPIWQLKMFLYEGVICALLRLVEETPETFFFIAS